MPKLSPKRGLHKNWHAREAADFEKKSLRREVARNLLLSNPASF
jgi:hypothetical protein